MKFVMIGCLFAGVLAAVGCTGGAPTRPTTTAAVSGLAAMAPGSEAVVGQPVAPSLSASPRSGDLHVTKECSGFTGAAGSFCAITSSNIQAIEVDSKIIYLQPDQLFSPSGSEVVLDPPGPGNNTAFGRCSLALGVCTFSGGTGKFTSFHARVDVSHTGDFSLWFWDGTYSFNPKD